MVAVADTLLRSGQRRVRASPDPDTSPLGRLAFAIMRSQTASAAFAATYGWCHRQCDFRIALGKSFALSRLQELPEMTHNGLNRTEHIAIRVSEHDYDRLVATARRDSKPLREWCRDKVLEAARPASPTPGQHAILAEILATQDIIVGLLCAMARDGRLTPQKAKEIADAAHERKYRDVAALFKEAESRRTAR
jgi:hypothetical protein